MLESAWLDRGPNDRVFLGGHHHHPLDRSWIFTAFIERSALLRTLCRAWRDAIDNTPDITRYILVNKRRNNVLYVQRYNHDRPLECFMNTGDRLALAELPSLLGPLTQRLHSLNIDIADTIMEPVAFPMLRVLRVFSQGSPIGLWGEDRLPMVHENPGLKVLVVDFSYYNSRIGALEPITAPPLRAEHSGLQIVQLTGNWYSTKSHVLQSLVLDSSVQLVVDNVKPAHLHGPDSALRNVTRSLTQMGVAGIIKGQLEIRGEYREHVVRFVWSKTGRFLPNEVFSELKSAPLTSSEALDMILELAKSGIVETIKLYQDQYWDSQVTTCISGKTEWQELLRFLGSVRRLVVHPDYASPLLLALTKPVWGGTGQGHQFPCPNLTQLEVSGSRPFSLTPARWWKIIRKEPWNDIPFNIYKLVNRRQSGRPLGNGLAKLERIGVPFQLRRSNYFKDPIFDGIDIYLP
ncbi:hypothetical protein M407DRAFT_24493 [Tulasnella calospora MUT 4182]|uniref:Uncharacterized protein n=1 Tax=Tulasnella calospora MUT 4182 TaxID=1051891 RepID=A0A0C3QJE1_9AGAM|nr:hypothetical protein M407DRAFT_24493 [Tulasnella calospora MUT 4182]